ncbi:MAG: AAA family ATPase [Rubripirellula sp.]
MSDDDDDNFNDPDEDTQFRFQNDKETRSGASHRAPPPWSEGDRIGDFRLEKLLGAGTSGFVYRVLDLRVGKRCALKLLRLGTSDDLLRNKLGFRKMMSLEHPNLRRVDRIHQLGSYTGLSMEEVDGKTLKQTIQDLKKVPLAEAYDRLLSLMRDFGAGLAVMHAKGYVHRDVKPDNLMVDRDGNGRLIDYGLVDSFDLGQATFNTRGFLLGTPHYFAPEVIWNQRYLPAGDIFSLGIVMLEALGSIQRASGQAKLTRSKHDNAKDAERIHIAFQELDDSIPGLIRETCREMLDRDPAERPTALQLARLGLDRTPTAWPLRDRIVGREDELAQISAWVKGIFAGQVGRLHLTGTSGLGKTRIIEQVIEEIEEKNWGQVFYAECRPREDQALQAFDQISDAIANRYMKGDRDELKLDPVSVAILQGLFPVLKSVLRSSMRVPPPAESSERLDALEAAVRLSEELRLVGPLFVVLDDVQWSDSDSLGVLDRLQLATGKQGLGVITISRIADDLQRVTPNVRIDLGPLEMQDAIGILRSSAESWRVDVSDAMLMAMAKAADCVPFRLREMADSFRPGGVFTEIDLTSDSINDTTAAELGLERLWQAKFERLSEEAKQVLLYVVTAGGKVSTEQLGELTGQQDAVDAAVSDLVLQRLIIDEATGGDCISMYHDHVADEMSKVFSSKERRSASHAWAVLLAKQDSPRKLAARIAGHFLEAGEPGRAVSHALLAAEDAEERVSPADAARWYECVVDQVDGNERIIQLRNAARCYHVADYPMKAAECYDKLSSLVSERENIECQSFSIALLIRSGRFSQVRPRLQELASALRLPQPKPRLFSAVMVGLAHVRGLMPWNKSLLEQVVGEESAEEAREGGPLACTPSLEQSHLAQRQQRLRLCLSLIRPMSMFDGLYAAELSAAATRLLPKDGSRVQQVHGAVGEAVFACYDKGARRMEGESSLLRLKNVVANMNSAEASGDLWAAIACSHTLACRWDQVVKPVESSIEHYDRVEDTFGFEKAHTLWPAIWANWHLGRWDELHQSADHLFIDAVRRNDLFQQLVSTGGYGSASWLARDEAAELKRLYQSMKLSLGKQVQLLDIFAWIGWIQVHLYEGDFVKAWEIYQEYAAALGKMPFSSMQLIRVTKLSLGSIIALQNLSAQSSQENASGWARQVLGFINRLRREQLPFSNVIANLHTGLLNQQMERLGLGRESDRERAKVCFAEARTEAMEHRLRPYQLAAEDALSVLQTGSSLGELQARMDRKGVVNPARLQRLYTVVIERPSDQD